jgi:antitoxin component YwqK of YwqJK toxin-antitoxin module
MKVVYLIVAVVICGCSPTQVVEKKDENGQLIERYEVDKKSGQKNGTYERLVDLMVVEKATYHFDTLHGVRTLYTAAGQKEIEETYQMGTYHGPYLSYHADGGTKTEGHYENGTMEGKWQRYYGDGQLMETVTMHLNQEEGPFVEYWENGKIKAEGSYLDGDNEHGELKLYDEQGDLEKIMQCERGICHTTWRKEMSAGQ